MNVRQFISVILSFIAFCLLSILLYWHFQLGMTRYFDVDEFAHLSWAFQMFSGRRPYVDFLFFFPPGFHLFLMPLFAFGGGIAPIFAARIVQFGIFVLLVGVTMLLFWLMRRSWTAIVAGVILAFLPMPFDKFLEIRPDTLAVLFAMLGMVFHVLASQDMLLRGCKRVSCGMVAGFFYGISLLILPKTLPQVGVAVGIELLRAIRFPEFLSVRQAGKKLEFRESFKGLAHLLAGMFLPISIFALWTLTLGNIDQVIYSLTKLGLEANKISQTFIMMPDLFFYPNVTFYGTAGWNAGLVTNHAMWLTAIFVGLYRLVTPGRSWSEFLIASTFFVYVIFYVQIVPLKHTQYLIPIVVFIAFYAADAVDMLWRRSVELSKNHANLLPTGVFLALFILGSIRLMQVFVAVNSPKRGWTNADTIKQLTMLYKTIPTTEYILDLTGETLYYKHPYVVCCTPFGQSAPYLSRPLPALIEALQKTNTKYIFEGGVKRVTTLLPVDQAYIAAHFLPSPTIGGLLIRK
ncbi:MAG: hypothetical protein Q8L37_02715 [Candidatus Gottesmanbacteria bacterium]|nr:hypothetical protein [Candidatus Gottesmanbacteria bacterium]